MTKIRFLMAATLVACGAAAHAASGQDTNADGSTAPHKKTTLATNSNRQLRLDDVPSARTAAPDVKAQADADMAARDARDKSPRLQVQRENLKNGDAARAIAQRTTPNTIDRDTAYGDKDHTEQVTDLKVTLKK